MRHIPSCHDNIREDIFLYLRVNHKVFPILFHVYTRVWQYTKISAYSKIIKILIILLLALILEFAEL